MSESPPSSPARQLVDRFRRDNWRFRRDDLARAVAADPAAVVEFMRLAIDEWPPGKPFLCDMTSLLPGSSFGEIALYALEALRRRSDNAAAASVIARVSLEAPHELHPYLADIFELRPNESTYYATWPWRESNDLHFDFLSIRATPTRGDFALHALLESRTPRALAVISGWGEEKWRAHLHLVGFEMRNGTARQLYDPQPKHLCPPAPPKTARQPCDTIHATWRFEPSHARRCFGGVGHRACCACGEHNHHLVSLEVDDLPANVTSRARLSIESCLSCVGWASGPLFYAHDAGGVPTGVHFEGEHRKPQFPAEPFPELEMAVVPTESRWAWQDWGLSGAENLNRIGGHPCWVQDAEYLGCPRCRQTMTFLMQLDSWLPCADGSEWLWGSGGICYVLWCDDCAISAVFWQCT